MIHVILCDDHALIRRGIRDTLSDAPDIEVVGEAGDYGELRALMRTRPARAACDVLVLDINLPGRSGLDVLHALKDEGSPVKVLVVSMYPEDQYAIRALRAGAFGYVNKGGDPQTLVQRGAHGGAGAQVRDARDRADAGREPDHAGEREPARAAVRPRAADAGDDRLAASGCPTSPRS